MSSYPIQRPEGPVPGESLMARFRHVEVIEVSIWGRRVGAVAADPGLKAYVFEYDPQSLRSSRSRAPHPPWSGSTVRSGAGPSLAPRLA